MSQTWKHASKYNKRQNLAHTYKDDKQNKIPWKLPPAKAEKDSFQTFMAQSSVLFSVMNIKLTLVQSSKTASGMWQRTQCW